MNRKMVVVVLVTLVIGIVIGAGMMQVDSVYTTVQSALGKENVQNMLAGNGVGGLYIPDLKNADLDALLQMVQSQRTQLLDTQLRDQMDEINKGNQKASMLNGLLGLLYRLSSSFQSTDADDTPITKNDIIDSILNSIAEVKSTLGLQLTLNTKSDVDKGIATVKSQIDDLYNAQQMDMLRLAQLSNKRNESFDIMTDFMKKMQDSRKTIIGNMR